MSLGIGLSERPANMLALDAGVLAKFKPPVRIAGSRYGDRDGEGRFNELPPAEH